MLFSVFDGTEISCGAFLSNHAFHPVSERAPSERPHTLSDGVINGEQSNWLERQEWWLCSALVTGEGLGKHWVNVHNRSLISGEGDDQPLQCHQ